MSFDYAVLFVGPSLRAELAQTMLDVETRPPAARGDLYLAAKEGPRAILLVDGAFEDVPATLHKEILWALSNGIHVFGAASLGALRAAELQPFGMVGIGAIFESYRSGRRERDDAVAVLHGPGELGWPLLTRALVDIEATLVRAQSQGVLSAEDRMALLDAAERLFWRDRTYPNLVAKAADLGWHRRCDDRFLLWTLENEVSQKESDAVALLRFVAERWPSLAEPFAPAFRFERTAAWHALTAELDAASARLPPRAFHPLESALRKDGVYESLAAEALLAIAAEEGLEAADCSDTSAFEAAAARFRAERNLTQHEDVVRWMKTNDISHSDYVAMVEGAQRLESVRANFAARLPAVLVRILRSRGLLARYRSDLGF